MSKKMCELCKEETIHTTTIGGGIRVCRDCRDYSMEIASCDLCDKSYHISALYKVDGSPWCESCIRKEFTSGGHDYMTWAFWSSDEGWGEDCAQDRSIGAYLKWHMDSWKDVHDRDGCKIILGKLLREQVEIATKGLSNAQ